MLKKLMIAELLLLAGTMLLGTLLISNLTSEIKIFHAGLGMLAGLNAIAITYLAYTRNSSPTLKYLSVVIVGLTFLAGVGGKYAETNYSSGLLLMRAAAVAAFVTTTIGLIKLMRSKAKSA